MASNATKDKSGPELIDAVAHTMKYSETAAHMMIKEFAASAETFDTIMASTTSSDREAIISLVAARRASASKKNKRKDASESDGSDAPVPTVTDTALVNDTH